jgi:hypothetical protein
MSPSASSNTRPRNFKPATLISAGLAMPLVIGLLVYLGTRNTLPPRVELLRKDLVIRAGLLCGAGGAEPFTGTVTDAYDGGELKSRSVVSNGVLEGLSQGWYTNGQLQVEEHFVAGVSHGLRTKWYPNGQPLSQVMIVEGKLQGRFRRWHETGALAEDVELSDGQPHGVAWSYYPSGFVKAEAHLQTGQVLAHRYWEDGAFKRPPTLQEANSQ